ncbi:MAG: hypothetical protein KH354_05555 [Clostridiales bacterium]|nr:hypothetical protein [Clostridiales bacterium]
MKIKRIAFAIVMTLFISFAIFITVVLNQGKQSRGIQEISAVTDASGNVFVNIKYSDCLGYSVQNAKEDERIYYGERAVRYDGFLGKNLIKITLYDTNVSDRLLKLHGTFKPRAFKWHNLRFMIAPMDDHSVVIYVGSDEELVVDEQNYTKLNLPFGSIRVRLAP